MIQRIKNYLQKTLGIEIQAKAQGNRSFPAYLGWSFDFYKVILAGHHCLLALQKPEAHLTPLAIDKGVAILSARTKGTVVFACETMPAYERQRLVLRKIPFIIPNRQLYLPFLALAFSEFGTKKPRSFEALGNGAQILLMRWWNGFSTSFCLTEAMESTGFSKPTVLRAFDELEYFGVARRQGKDRRLFFLGTPWQQWVKQRDSLPSPCRRIIGLEALPPGLEAISAGTEALARRSSLNPPEWREVAIFHTDYSRNRQREIPAQDAPVRLELWNYPPLPMPDGGVDPFSLWLTLKAKQNERLQLCLEEMMGRVL